MTVRKPPAFAAWLLKRFVSCYRAESLLGDLFEEYQTGRTPSWYWREVIAVLLVSARRSIRRVLSSFAVKVVVMLIGQLVLIVGMLVVSGWSSESCPSPMSPLSDSTILMMCVGVAEAAATLLLWLGSRGGKRRANLVRLSVAAFAAVALSGGALTWASTSSCAMSPLICAPSSVAISCAR